MNRWLHTRLLDPLARFLKQGLSPEKLALCLTLGLILSIFPWFGTTTLLCTVAALALGLNLAAIQLANWLAAPLQLLLLLPFVRVGEKITGHPPLPLSAREISVLFEQGFRSALQSLGTSLLDAALGWLVLAPVAGFLVYLLLVGGLRRWARRAAPGAVPTEGTA